MRVVDCVPFFNELDVLRVRLAELAPVVDHFVIVEAFETHQGRPKPWHVPTEGFFPPELEGRISHVRISGSWPLSKWGKSGTSHPPPGRMLRADWARENAQRNTACEALRRLALRPDDVVLVSDVDEIPRREAIGALKGMMRDDPDRLVVLTGPMYRLEPTLLDPNSCPDHPLGYWSGPYAVSARHVFRTFDGDLSALRQCRHAYKAAFSGAPNRELRNAAWHLTWMGDLAKFQTKAASVARHYEGNYEGSERSQSAYDAIRARLIDQSGNAPECFPWALRAGISASGTAQPPHPSLDCAQCEEVDRGLRAVCDTFEPHNTVAMPEVRWFRDHPKPQLAARAEVLRGWFGTGTVLLLEDGWNVKLRPFAVAPEGPVAAFGRPLAASTPELVPDPELLLRGGAIVKEVDSLELPPWEDRADSAVWRGASTGGLWSHDPGENPRVQLCACGEKGVDARLTSWVQYPGEAPPQLMGGRLSMAEQLRGHKVLLLVDGNAAAWEGTLWRLLSGVPVVWYKRRYRAWLDPEPWEHYVPCEDLAEELPALLRRAYAGEFRELGQNAQRWAKEKVGGLQQKMVRVRSSGEDAAVDASRVLQAGALPEDCTSK